MKQEHGRAFSPSLFFAISIIGLALVHLLVAQTNLDRFQFTWQRGLIGILFCMLCVSGVAAVFYPVKCRGLFQHTPNLPVNTGAFSNGLRIEGHHPSCEKFSENRITVGGRVFCAACSGLLVGAAFALGAAVVYFFVGLNMVWGGFWMVVLGEVGMVLGLVQIKVAGFVKVVFNAVFVAGSFVTLAAVDAIGRSLFVDFYVLGLIFFLLWFRISLSEWNNWRTCHECQSCFH